VDLPNAQERARIFEIHIRKRGRDAAKFDLARLAAATDGFSGAEIEQSVISALYDVFYGNRELVTEDLLRSAGETVPLFKTMSERISELRAWAQGRARLASTPDSAASAAPRRKLEI
jgi:SpoVK/Ycf46/Vps4 family AAA+-type ATPase